MEWCYHRAGLCRVYGEGQARVDSAVYSPQVRAPESRIPPGDVSYWSFVQALEECRRPGELTWRCSSLYICLCHVTRSEIWKHAEAIIWHLLTEKSVYEYLCNSKVWVFLHDTAHCLLACPFFDMNSSTKITIWNTPLTSLITGTLSNKNPLAWNFLSPELKVTWRTVSIISWVVLLSQAWG